MLRTRNLHLHNALLGAAIMAAAGSAGAQQLASDPIVQANFSRISQIGTGVGDITQMTFGPDGRLYVSTFTSGIKRYDYDAIGGLTNGVTVWSRQPSTGQLNGSLGVAFHEDAALGTVMYIAPAVTSGFNPTLNRVQSILRLTDNDGDGGWGEAGELNQAIVNNLRVTDLHQANQILIDDDTLYVGIGSRTRTGGQRSEYGGAANVDDGEFAYTGAINWIRDLTTLSADRTTANIAGLPISQHHASTLPFTSQDPGKLTVYSTGFRNVYGIALDGEGQLWATMNQNENPLKPDELHRSEFRDDHKFFKANEVSGDWKANPDALASGYFDSLVDPVALLSNHASANGIEFTNVNNAFAGHPFVVRFQNFNDLIAIDPATGAVRSIATGFSDPIEVVTDPNGNLLVGEFGGRVHRVTVAAGAGLVFGDLNGSGLVDAADWMQLRDNFNADMSGLTGLEAYALGDLNSDFKNDGLDFALFKTAFENLNGAGSFAAMLHVPEPTARQLSVLGGLAMGIFALRRD